MPTREDFDPIGSVLDAIDVKAHTADLVDADGLGRVRRDKLGFAAKFQANELS